MCLQRGRIHTILRWAWTLPMPGPRWSGTPSLNPPHTSSATSAPRWSYRRRLAAALVLLRDPVLDRLIAPPLAFKDLPARLPEVFAADSNVICPLIRYPAADETQ